MTGTFCFVETYPVAPPTCCYTLSMDVLFSNSRSEIKVSFE